MMVEHGSTRTSGVGCASLLLPIQDQLRLRGYDRPEPGRPLGLLITSPSMNDVSHKAAASKAYHLAQC
jgi:hypothetical protein